MHWDAMDEYVSIKDDDKKVHKFMVEDLYRLEPYMIKGEENATK